MRSRHDLAALATKPFGDMTKGERIAATKAGIIPPIRTERERQLRSRYGLTLEAYDALLAQQDGVCALCLEAWGSRDLYVDHHHASGHVRGLLCAGCNSLVGVLETRMHLLPSAMTYVFFDPSCPDKDDRYRKDVA